MTDTSEACRDVLTTAEPAAKVKVARAVAQASRRGNSTGGMVAALERAGDMRSAAIPGRIYRDEIRHVGAGMNWFLYRCESLGLEPVGHWKTLVRRHFRGVVKPPFNDSARREAGLSRDFYAAIAE